MVQHRLLQPCGGIFNRSPGICFGVHLRNRWKLFISKMCRHLILRPLQASLYCSKRYVQCRHENYWNGESYLNSFSWTFKSDINCADVWLLSFLCCCFFLLTLPEFPFCFLCSFKRSILKLFVLFNIFCSSVVSWAHIKVLSK